MKLSAIPLNYKGFVVNASKINLSEKELETISSSFFVGKIAANLASPCLVKKADIFSYVYLRHIDL